MKVRRSKNEINEQWKTWTYYGDKWQKKWKLYRDDKVNDVVLVLSVFHVDRTLEDNWSYPSKPEICLPEKKKSKPTTETKKNFHWDQFFPIKCIQKHINN